MPENFIAEHTIFKPIFVTIFVSIVALCVYAATLNPAVAGGDAGELMVVAHELGTAHPPGYPSFTMYSKLSEVVFKELGRPWGFNNAKAMNFGQAVLSALAVGFLCQAGTELTGRPHLGVLAGVLFGFSPAVWTYAVVTEVFPLNNLMVAMLLWSCVRYYTIHVKICQRHAQEDQHGVTQNEKSAKKFVCFAAFLCGMASTNQHTVALFLLPIGVWVFWLEWLRGSLSIRSMVLYGLLYVLGLTPYLYLPWSATFIKSKESWGDCGTLSGLLTHVLRSEYGTFSLASKESRNRVWNFIGTTEKYFKDLQHQTLQVLWILGVIGLIFGLCRGLRRGVCGFSVSVVFCIMYLFYIAFFHSLANLPLDDSPLYLGVMQRFWIQPLSVTSLFIVLGWAELEAFATSSKHEKTPNARRSIPSSRTRGFVLYLSVAAALALATLQIGLHYKLQDESDNYTVADFGRAILEPLRKNSILLTKGDLMINSARYNQVMEGVRPDVVIMDQEMMTYEWMITLLRHRYSNVTFPGDFYYPGKKRAFSMQQLLKANFHKFPVHVAQGWKEGDSSIRGHYTARNWGLSIAVIKAHEKFSNTSLLKYIKATRTMLPPVETMRLPPAVHRFPPWAWELVARNDYWVAHSNVAYTLLEIVEDPKSGLNNTVLRAGAQRAVEIYDMLYEKMTPWPSAVVLRNYGVALQKLMNLDPAAGADPAIAEKAAHTFARYLEEMKRLGNPEDKSIQSAADYYTDLAKQLNRRAKK